MTPTTAPTRALTQATPKARGQATVDPDGKSAVATSSPGRNVTRPRSAPVRAPSTRNFVPRNNSRIVGDIARTLQPDARIVEGGVVAAWSSAHAIGDRLPSHPDSIGDRPRIHLEARQAAPEVRVHAPA